MRFATIFLGGVLLARAAFGADSDWKPFWNGKDLNAWTVWLAKPHASTVVDGVPKDAQGAYAAPIGARDPVGVFTVVDADGKPAIRVSGQVFAELRSRESLTDFHLKLQFKWGVKKWPPRDRDVTRRDSGILYHVHSAPGAEGKTWARSIELQIQERDVGDLYAVNSQIAVRSTLRAGAPGPRPVYDYDPAGEWHTFSQVGTSDGRCVKQPDNEKPNGEWNTVEIVALGEDAIHIVNGKVVMRLRGPRRIDGPAPAPVTSGPIVIQSEGAELFYRDLVWRPIKSIPAEFAEN